MSNEFNPFAPPEELPETTLSRPWLEPVRLEKRPPRLVRSWRDAFRFARWKPFLQLYGIFLGPFIAAALFCTSLTLIHTPFVVGIHISLTLMYPALLFAATISQRCILLDRMFFVAPLFPEDSEEARNIAVQVVLWKRSWFFMFQKDGSLVDNGLLRFEGDGLQFTGNTLELFIPYSAGETCTIQKDALSARIALRKTCSPDWKIAFFTLIPHRLKWYSLDWRKVSLAFLERLTARF